MGHNKSSMRGDFKFYRDDGLRAVSKGEPSHELADGSVCP